MSSRASRIAAIAVLTVAVACGGGGDDEATDTNAGSPGNGGGQGTSQAQAQRSVKEPAAADLANFSCERGKQGAWAAQGDITSSAKSAMVYTVTVVAVRGDDEVVGEKIRRFELEPEETTSFEFPKFHRGPADSCLPRLQRAPSR